VVEDNDEHAEWIEQMIQEGTGAEFEAVRVTSLTDALSALERTTFDLMLLDLGLPDLSGYKCSLAMNLMAPALPIIVLTGDERDLTRQMANLCGTSAFLLKTTTTSRSLANAITDALNGGAASAVLTKC
jgi:CheY-like chemotaxis protein